MPASAHTPSQRLAAVEWLRLAAIGAVVYYHLGAGPLWLAMTGVMCFVSFMVAFGATSTHRNEPMQFIRVRAQRLLVPWVFWSGVYAVAKLARAIAAHERLATLFQPWMLVAGSSLHLWFLPWAFCVTVVVGLWVVKRPFYQSAQAWRLCVAAAVLLCVLSTHAYPILHRSGICPAHMWVLYTPPIAVGLALAKIRPGTATATPRLLALLVGVGLAGLAAAWCGYTTVAAAMTLSIMLCALSWRIPLAAGPWTLRIGGLSYGIYIVHLLVAKVFSRVWPGTPEFEQAGIVLICSGLAVLAIQLTPLRRVV